MKLLVFAIGLLTASAVYAKVISTIINTTIREVFMGLGVAIIGATAIFGTIIIALGG